jgi:hypothetical protein
MSSKNSLPLPLGEGWGEGLHEEPEHIFLSPLLGPHPNPLPEGEGIYR